MIEKPGLGGGLEFLQKLFAGAFKAKVDRAPVRPGKHSAKGAPRPAGSKLKRLRSRSHMWG